MSDSTFSLVCLRERTTPTTYNVLVWLKAISSSHVRCVHTTHTLTRFRRAKSSWCEPLPSFKCVRQLRNSFFFRSFVMRNVLHMVEWRNIIISILPWRAHMLFCLLRATVRAAQTFDSFEIYIGSVDRCLLESLFVRWRMNNDETGISVSHSVSFYNYRSLNRKCCARASITLHPFALELKCQNEWMNECARSELFQHSLRSPSGRHIKWWKDYFM